MACSRFIVLVVLLGNYSWGIRPGRFRTGLHRQHDDIALGLSGRDFTGVTSKDANPYVTTYREMLADVGNLMTQHKIVWHITCGTLLGWQRMGRFLPYDEDLDIYVANKPFENKETFARFKEAVAALKKGYTFGYEGGPVYRVTKDKIPNMVVDGRGRGPKGEGTWVDIYQYEGCNQDSSWCIGFELPKEYGHDGRLRMDQLLPPKSCQIDTVATMCPQNAVYLLDAYYGEGKWQTPKVQYCEGEWKTSCGTAVAVAAPASSTISTANSVLSGSGGASDGQPASGSSDNQLAGVATALKEASDATGKSSPLAQDATKNTDHLTQQHVLQRSPDQKDEALRKTVERDLYGAAETRII